MKTRRSLLTFGFSESKSNKENKVLTGTGKVKIKMLTSDGHLVEIDKDLFDNNNDRKQASNNDIFHWIKKNQGK